MSKKVFIFACVISSFLLLVSMPAHALNPALDWDWSFTKVTDGSDNVITELIGLSSSTQNDIFFTATPTGPTELKFYGTMFIGQDFLYDNISFSGASSTGFGPNPWPYGLGSFVDYWALNNRLNPDRPPHPDVISAGTYEFMFRSMPLTMTAPVGGYDFTGSMFIYDLIDDPDKNQNIGVHATNDIFWRVDGGQNAVPEPATMFLFGSGLAGFALRRRKA